MRTKRILGAVTALLTAAALTVGNISYAAEKEIEVNPKITQYGELCGKVNVNILSDANIYIKITKHTPESSDEGYTIYDTVIKANDVYSEDYRSVMKLECINYNIEKQVYDGHYNISVGVHKHIGSEDPEDIVYKDIYFIVTDKDVSGYDTVCDINVSLSDTDMEEPEVTSSSEIGFKKYDIVFPYIEMPPEPSDIDVLWGDANEDNKVNIRDAALIASRLATGNGDELPKSADYNQDGSVNIRDAAALAKDLATR